MTETLAGADETEGAPQPDAYARGARILSIGIASTGIFTFAYFAVASHVLDASEYGAISLLWAVLFVVISVIYRPVEQLLSRTIADRRARGHHGRHPLRIPLLVQAGFATAFLVVALALQGPITDAFDSTTLYWVFVGATLAYAASYFARGYMAGHQWFALYGGLVLFESVSRFCFPVAVAVGLAHGQSAVALGILAAPVASLLVVPWAIVRHSAADAPATVDDRALTLRAGAGFAASVAAIQLAEQALLNASVLTVSATAWSSTRCSSRARRCSSSSRSRRRCCPTSAGWRPPRATRPSPAPSASRCWPSSPSPAPWRSGCCSSGRGR